MRLPWNRTQAPQLDLLSSLSPLPETDIGELLTVPQPIKMPAIHMPALEALLSEPTLPGQPLLVPLASIFEDPANPRTEFSDEELDELAADIRQHGILQPIVVHPADAAGRWRIHFGAKRLRAAKRAGLIQVPVTVRQAADDPYTQVAENQKRHGLSALDLARFIRCRVDQGESNAAIAGRLGMDLTSVAHHLALLELPAPLAAALKSGRCAAPRTLYELSKLHVDRPEAVLELLQADHPITREAVAALRRPKPKARLAAQSASSASKTPKASKPSKRLPDAANAAELTMRAERLCVQLTAVCSRLRTAGFDQAPAGQLASLRAGVDGLKALLGP